MGSAAHRDLGGPPHPAQLSKAHTDNPDLGLFAQAQAANHSTGTQHHQPGDLGRARWAILLGEPLNKQAKMIAHNAACEQGAGGRDKAGTERADQSITEP